MKGQWTGTFNGTSTGRIIINIDELHTCFQGIAYLIQENKEIPNTAAYFRTTDKSSAFEFTTSNLAPVNPWPGTPDNWNNVKDFYSNGVMPNFAKVKGSWSASQ